MNIPGRHAQHRAWLWLLLLVAGCNSDSNDGTPDMGGDGGIDSEPDAGPLMFAIDPDCQGFDFKGLVYSPGGTVLPNTCEPFHQTLNNPYAVRCVDAWPWYATQYAGDELCILPPPPDKGLQVGVHPQGKQWHAQVSVGDLSGYEDLSDEWLMESGGESVMNYRSGLETDEEKNYFRNNVRMRAGSHHAIVSHVAAGMEQEVWFSGDFPPGLFDGNTLPSVQRVDENSPDTLETPEEDAGLFNILPAGAGVVFNIHHFNSTDDPILKEMWLNLWYAEVAETRVFPLVGLDFAQATTLSVEPGQSQDLHYSWEITEPTRIVKMTGHRHVWTTSFSTWVEHADGEATVLYQSFDWFDQPTYRYNSRIDNPTPDAQVLVDGASSGLLVIEPGEKLHFSCHIDYTEERAAAEGAPSPTQNGVLGFANQAYTAEMCLLFGGTTGVSLPAPKADDSPIPDFAVN